MRTYLTRMLDKNLVDAFYSNQTKVYKKAAIFSQKYLL